jgi:uncharacterized membrane protein
VLRLARVSQERADDCYPRISALTSPRRPGRGYARVWALALALALAAVVAWLVPASLGSAVRVVAAWDAAVVLLLGYSWGLILRNDARLTRERAAAEDPGKAALFVVTVVAGMAGLATAVLVLRAPESYMPPDQIGSVWLLITLGIVAVVGAWLLVHSAYTFHYAHLYYREDGSPGGLEFPGEDDPDDYDFAYFAFTIGMTFQTSDVDISDRGLRRVVLGHALLSFTFNTAILALAVSLLSDRLV